jgi:Adenovirus endoprotease
MPSRTTSANRVKRLLKHDRRGLSTVQIATFLQLDPVIRQRKTLVKVLPCDMLPNLFAKIATCARRSDASCRTESAKRRRSNRTGGSTDAEIPPIAVVVNTDTSSQPGTHWLACFRDSVDGVTFFDSYGEDVQNYDSRIGAFCKKLQHVRPVKKCNTTIRNNRGVQLQSDTTSVCGLQCILLLMLLARGYTIDDMIRLMHSPTHGLHDSMLSKTLLCSQTCVLYSRRSELDNLRRLQASSAANQTCCSRRIALRKR